MNDQINREIDVHGREWHKLHEGYFSNPDVASPLITKTLEIAAKSKAGTIVDLGGGVGFLLSQLLKNGIDPNIALINLDGSENQLNEILDKRIMCAHNAVDQFKRSDLGDENNRFLYLMRSVLHYFGESGLRSALRHIRSQTQPGEFFIHQTASFEHAKDADIMNTLYKLMYTDKWYPTVAFLKESLEKEGWHVMDILPAESLKLTQQELQLRYNLSSGDILNIQKELSTFTNIARDVFVENADGFTAYLHYWIYICEPV